MIKLNSKMNIRNIRNIRNYTTKLSVNINKFALIRNARDQNTPHLIDIAKKCINYGSHGITIHPRPDERHIKYDDIAPLKNLINTYPGIEFNIEGYPSTTFIKKVLTIKPHQVTLVPDPPDALTSSFGWDLIVHKQELSAIIAQLKHAGIRTSLFIDPDCNQLKTLQDIQPDRVELYTYNYNNQFKKNKQASITPYKKTVDWITTHTTIGINAGHDLNLDNLNFLITHLPEIKEVSIGHQLVCDCLEMGLKETIKAYLHQLH